MQTKTWILATAMVAAGCLSGCGSKSDTATTTTPTASAGMQIVKYQNISLEVPSSWQIQQANANNSGCVTNIDKIVILGDAAGAGECLPPTPGSQNVSLRIASASAAVDPTTSTVLKNGAQAWQHIEDQRDPQVAIVGVDSQKVQISFAGPFGNLRTQVLDSVKVLPQ